MSRRSTYVLPFVLVAALAAASQPLTLTTPEQENKMGEDAYKDILNKEELCQNKDLVAHVERVARRVIAAAPDKGFSYEISVLESPIVNAFCLPGGKICVYTGILPYCQNEAGLGTVISHEVAHAILRHGGQRMTQNTVTDLIGQGLGKVLEYEGASSTTEKIAMGAYGYGTQLGILLPYSRSHETEADLNGLLYLAKAGYDPKEAPEFWKRFSVLKSSTPTFMSTHPAHEDREQRLEQNLPKALKLYEQSPKIGAGETLPPAYLTIPKTEVATKTNSTQSIQKEEKPVASTEAKPKKKKSTALSSLRLEDLAEGEIRKGLQAALSNGFRSAIKMLGKEDGFLLDEAVKVVMPEKLAEVEKLVRAVGKGSLADDFIKQMNRAAEKAAPGTADILAQAIAGLSLDDARGILKGRSDEATQYFKRTCDSNLQQQILPIVKEATASVGATKAYKNLTKKAGMAATLLLGDFDLDAYVTRKAVDGLYLKIADEEKRIRENPAGQASDILQKVFGVLQK
ncbi:MAG TPA: DUF4197 family protein [Planctomycetota bacterium]|jgi:predicted Zn-dependent protease